MCDKMQCHPTCPFFQDNGNFSWDYDKDKPYLKKRKTPAEFICGYDGHTITNWYSPCPKKLENSFNKKEKKDDKNF